MSYIGKSPSGSGVRTRYYFTQSSGGGTSISGTDDNGKTLTYTDGEYVDVYLNGVLLVHGTDYGTGTANTISSLAALASGDVVEVVVYDIFNVAKINNEAVRKRYYKTASGSETSISGADDSGATITFPANAEIEVKLNGVALVQGTDYNTTTANTVGGLSALSAGQVVEVVVYERFVLGDTVSKADGGTFASAVGFSDGVTIDDDGAAPLTVDRATSNGDVITLQKNGSTVGSVGVTADGAYIAGKTDTALFLNDTDDNIYTITTGLNNRDNTTDLGRSNARFKNLYLGGNLYIGGTGSANALNDYEEGTWTPVVGHGDEGTATYQAQQGKYTKVGRWVAAEFDISINQIGTGSDAQMSGLPFSMGNHGGVMSGYVSFYSGLKTSVYSLDCYVIANTSNILFTGHNSQSTGVFNSIPVFQNSTRVLGTIHYFT